MSADGDAGIVLGAGLAELLLIAAGDDVLLLERDRPGVSVEVPEQPRSDSAFRTCPAAERERRPTTTSWRGRGSRRWPGRGRLLAAEAVGGATDCVEAAVDYAKVRQQFGRTIATFQAVKHHCANMLVAAESATAAVWDASRAASED